MHSCLPVALLACLLAISPVNAQTAAATPESLEPRIAALQPAMVEWRRDIHANPELSGHEVRTAKLVADHLRRLGLEVKTEVGGHGVVGILRGGLPGKVVALRADMDALPVAEATQLPFASKAWGRHLGKVTPVMHACGHDGHVAILMGVADLLAGAKAQIAGTVKFLFQPAEEGMSEAPTGKARPSWGAKAMIEDGVLENPKVDAVFGLHITGNLPLGMVGYRSGPMMAAADAVNIVVTGKQTHGAAPWGGVDPVTASAQIVLGLQTIVSRQLNITTEPVVLTIGAINGGNRGNIVPDSVEMLGSLRTFDEGMRQEALKRIVTTAESIATASGAKATVTFGPTAYPVTTNDAALTAQMLPSLQRATDGKAVLVPKISGSEDFSEFQKAVPGLFYILGATPKGQDARTAPTNHSPLFDFDEDAMQLGVKTLAGLALDYLNAK